MAEPPEKIMEEREDLMVSPTGGIPSLRRAHFLNPTFSTTSSSHSLPFRPSVSLSQKPIWPLKVTFNGWRNPTPLWVQWVHTLATTHQATWKKAGVFDAIMGSTFKICINEEVFMGIAERWCSETNTFVLPWGEATVTLEDMVVLGGYPVLGNACFLKKFDDRRSAEVKEKLDAVHLRISRSRSQRVTHSLWMKHFMEQDGDVEHEAFLSLWLSLFVFPSFPVNVVSKRFFRLAIRLARGTQVALAPIVLASIYRDLTLLKSSMDASMEVEKSEIHDQDAVYATTLWAPLHLVQVWAWERFVELRPNPGVLRPGHPRLARWHLSDRREIGNVRPILQSAGDTFQWRPYTMVLDNLPLPEFYREKEEIVLVDSDMDVAIEAFARCLRVSELRGVDCVEMYGPHRVAMQFGLDQDIPDHVPKLDVTPEFAWLNYTRPIKDELLYFPSRHAEADVTTRYLKWQRQSVLGSQAGYDHVPRGRGCSKRVKRLVSIKKEAMDAAYGLDAPPGFHKKYNKLVMGDLEKNDRNGFKEADNAAYRLGAPPGFHKTYNKLVGGDHVRDEGNHIPGMLKAAHCVGNGYKKGEENGQIGSGAKSPSSSIADNETSLRAELTMLSGLTVLESEAVRVVEYEEVDENNERDVTQSVFHDAGKKECLSTAGCSVVHSLLDRIGRLEKSVAQLAKSLHGQESPL